MSIKLHVADYVIIAITLLISAAVGLYFRFTGGRQATTIEFLMAGKNMKLFPVIFSLTATVFSAVSIIGFSADVYLYGFHLFVLSCAYPIGGLLSAYIILPIYFDMNISTTYEFLGKRFGKATRYIASILYCIQMVLSTTLVLYAPSLSLSTVTGLPLWVSVLSMALVCTFYSTMGGLKAVLWTDVFQSFLMFTAVFAVLIKAILETGGFERVYEIASTGGRLTFFNFSTSFTDRYTVWNCLINGLVGGLYFMGSCQTQMQRMMSVRSLKRAQRSYLMSIPISVSFFFLCGLSGAVMYSYFYNCDPLQDESVNIKRRDQIFPYAIMKLFTQLPGMPGLCIAGIFSASLSTMSSALNAIATVSLQDVIKPLTKRRNLKDSTINILAKILAATYGGVTILLAFFLVNNKGLTQANLVISGLLIGPMLGVYLLGFFTSSANELGTLTGLILGLSINAWMSFGSLQNRPRDPNLPLSTAGCISRNNSYMEGETVGSTEDIMNLSDENDRYVFPLYRISHLWFSTISLLIVLFVGYTASLLVGVWKKEQTVDPQYLSLVFKKWKCRKEKYLSVPLNSNQIEFKEQQCRLKEEDA